MWCMMGEAASVISVNHSSSALNSRTCTYCYMKGWLIVYWLGDRVTHAWAPMSIHTAHALSTSFSFIENSMALTLHGQGFWFTLACNVCKSLLLWYGVLVGDIRSHIACPAGHFLVMPTVPVHCSSCRPSIWPMQALVVNSTICMSTVVTAVYILLP